MQPPEATPATPIEPTAAEGSKLPPAAEPAPLAHFTTATQTLIDRILEQPGMADRIEAEKSVAAAPATPEPTTPAPAIAPSSSPYSLLPAALLLLSRQFSDQWPAEMRLVLPCEQSSARSEAVGSQVWAPVVAWLLLRSLPPQLNNDAVFDQLRLRSVLAEIFSAFGLEGDDAWRAAARVRILLSLPELTASTALSRPATWHDTDIRWLAGVTDSNNITYVNEELFAALLSWLQLPALLWVTGLEAETPGHAAAKALPPIESVVAKTLTAVHTAGFQLEAFLHPPEPTPATPTASSTQTNAPTTRKPRTYRKTGN